SGSVADHVKHKVALRFEPRGTERLKNIAEPVSVYRVAVDVPAPARADRRSQAMRWAAALLLVLAAGAGAWRWWPGGPATEAVTRAPPSPPASDTAQKASRGSGGDTALVGPADEGIPVIVVLPFRDLTGNQVHSDLGAGIAEAFMTDLASFPDFEVVSST